MKPTDRKAFLEIVIGFAELKGKYLSAPALELYWNAMQDWELADFQAAANRLLKTSEFMPTPKDFEDLRKAGRETAGEVFASIGQWIVYSPHGHTLHPETPRSIASAIRAMGGPGAYMMCAEDKLPFLERRFCEHYEQISAADDTREAVPQIAYGEAALQLSPASGTFKSIGKVPERSEP